MVIQIHRSKILLVAQTIQRIVEVFGLTEEQAMDLLFDPKTIHVLAEPLVKKAEEAEEF